MKGKRRKLIIAAVVILIALGFFAFNYFRVSTSKIEKIEKAESIPVQVMRSQLVNLQHLLEQTGDIRPAVEVDVYPKAPGRIIESLNVEKGDFLNKGALIAVLEDRTIKAQIEEATAVLEVARSNLDVIEKDYRRMESLYRENALAKQKLDHIEAQRRSAAAQIKRAEAALSQLMILYSDHSIYAPISGYVSARYVDRGALSSVMQPIIRISSEEVAKVVTSITEKDFPLVKKGMKIEVRVDAFSDKVFTGTVSVINPTLDPATRSGQIEVHIPNKHLLLRSGMFAHVKLHLGEKKALVIERDALNMLAGTGDYYVYVVEKGRAVLKNIKTGLSQGNYVEITDGLREGEEVVVRGQSRIRDGVDVAVRQEMVRDK
ncbi:MAG: efflux RND transporter periplasmic adaptor subunit [Syntrophales bacterium]|nr:efflux RND transporter periplasmic adaptor subunit [Syntrophales bacterium]